MSETSDRPHFRRAQEGSKWVICGPVNVMTPNGVVEVFRKDGTSSHFQIAEMGPEGKSPLGKPFDKDGGQWVYAYEYTELKGEEIAKAQAAAPQNPAPQNAGQPSQAEPPPPDPSEPPPSEPPADEEMF